MALALPRSGFQAATQELIAFLSLLMAGLLPAMILTATILRGTGFSARRIDDYGRALRQQLVFWAVLFTAAGVSTAGTVLTKIWSAEGVAIYVSLGDRYIDQHVLTSISVAIAGGGLGVTLQRIRPAYLGLVSLLSLNIKMSRAEALSSDRARLDALSVEAEKLAKSDPYGQNVIS